MQPSFQPNHFLAPPIVHSYMGEQVPDYEATLEKKDFFPKIFLIPSEVRLDKYKGLVVIKRTDYHPDKFYYYDVHDIHIDAGDFVPKPSSIIRQDIKVNPAGHGLLSLFKKSNHRKIKLAICICVYSESKAMLKSTIKGIQESYKHFYQKAGIMSHYIIMIVIFDGIEKVNNSKDQTENMISYFNYFDLKNGFRHKPYGKTVEYYFKEFGQSLENYDDISIFTEKYLTDLKCKLFEHQYKYYTRIKSLQEEIQALKKNKDIKIDQLPPDVMRKYEELCFNYCIYNNAACAENRDEIQEYLSTKKEVRFKLIIYAIRETELLCFRYLESRKDKAILYPVRMESSDLDYPRKQQAKKDMQNKPSPNQSQELAEKEYQYMFFCVKHTNGGKLSSHLLFFYGFCRIFDPYFCILMDVGLKPKEDAIYKMWAYMEKNPKCGGVCGYMELKLENPADDLGYRVDGFDVSELDWVTRTADYFVNIQRAQQFEYHYAHMLDKPFEAFFNYIHVLPGAFSGYRWKALQSIRYDPKTKNTSQENIPTTDVRPMFTGASEEAFGDYLLRGRPEENTLMKKYLKTAMSDKIDLTLEESNMYLAEDRIMCLGIHALGYDLAYLPDAASCVDPVTSLTRMMGQRRRWINGSWFAFEYVFKHRSLRTSCIFLIQLIYYWLVQRLTFISIALFYIAITMTVSSAAQEYLTPAIARFFGVHMYEKWRLEHYKWWIFDVNSIANSVPHVINFIYIMLITATLYLSLSLNQNNKRFSRLYYFTSSLLGVYGIITFVLLVYNTICIVLDIANKNLVGDFIIPAIYLKAMILFIIVGHAIPVIWTFSFSKWIDMLTALPSYIFYVPSYVNILLLYAFCRIDDLSWGTKGLDEDVDRKKTLEWKKEKFRFVCIFLIVNVLIAFAICQVIDLPRVRGGLILAIACLVVFLLSFRLIFAFFYLLKYWLKSCFLRFSSEMINSNLQNGKQVLLGLKNIYNRIKEIEKRYTKQKKEQQFIELKNSKIFESRTLSSIGTKLRQRITQHIIDNNVIPKKEIVSERKRYRSKRKILLKKKLNVIEELSNESEDTRNFESSRISERNESPERLVVPRPARQERQNGANQIKERIEQLKNGKVPKLL